MAAPEQQPQVTRIPTPLALAESQMQEAIEDLDRAAGNFPRLPWPSGSGIAGPLIPGHLWVIGARPGNGKTSYLLNVFDAMAEQGWPVLFITTEMRAAEMRRLWAGMQLGYPERDVLTNNWDALPDGAAQKIRGHLEWQTYAAASTGLFVDLPRLDADHVKRVLQEYALACGYRIVILDHIHRWQVREISQKTAEMTAVVQGLKGSAVKHGLTILLAAQLNRGQDRSPMSEFLPAPLSALKQTAALEEECNVALMLHRQRRRDATVAMVKEVVNGQREVRDLIEPGILCASVGKMRHNEASVGRMMRLKVQPSRRLEDADPPAAGPGMLPLDPDQPPF